MNRFDRQARISGWDQARLAEARVGVYGRTWTGAFTVWALGSMGVGEVIWIGPPRRALGPFADWLLVDPPFEGVRVAGYPFAVEHSSQLEWALTGSGPGVLLCCESVPGAVRLSRAVARERRWFFAGGRGDNGCGFYRETDLLHAPGCEDPVAAMLAAGLLADAAREMLCPLRGGSVPPDGWAAIGPPVAPLGRVVLVGVGGIGVYAAAALAAVRCPIHLVDHDRVELTNLNRQGLFTSGDVRDSAPKAIAARTALLRLFPRADVTAEVRQVGLDFGEYLAAARPSVILSAVDNARTRVVLQELGREAGIPVVQGGTDIFAADCFTQGVTGPSLDVQMHGALSTAAAREGGRARAGGCAADPSYVVPGMVAGALTARRCLQVVRRAGGLPPIRWRAGLLPADQGGPADGFAELDLRAC
jgi:molybdopterin/thiamine biosynthesis adenylyltransferase